MLLSLSTIVGLVAKCFPSGNVGVCRATLTVIRPRPVSVRRGVVCVSLQRLAQRDAEDWGLQGKLF